VHPPSHPDLTVEDIVALLAGAAERPVEVGDGSGRVLDHSHLQHALQVAAVLRAADPGDEELAVAGLVHDVGHLLAGVGDAEHASVGALVVRAALGERVAGLVGLHVEAKRYLVAAEGYSAALSADSVSSLARQGGAMSEVERREFESLVLSEEAVRLRRADEGGKVPGLMIGELSDWYEALDRVHRHAG
jgi:predicted HD phosphohydrolase